jgi:integrase
MPYLTDAFCRSVPPPARANKVHFDTPNEAPESRDAVVVGLGLRVTSADHKAFVLKYRLKDGSGVQRLLTLGRFPYLKVENARELARTRRREIEKGNDPQAAKAAKRREPTINKLADDWEAALGRKVKAEMLRASTASGYERALRLHIRPQLGHLKISAITKKALQRFHEQITLDGKRVQANRSVGVLSIMMSWAVDQELLAANPVTKAVKFNTEEPRVREFTPEECARFVAELVKHTSDHQSAKAIQLILLTGARRTEVTSMRWTDLVLGGERPEWRRKGFRLKGKKDHTVPLNAPAHQMLLAISDEITARDGALGTFVFPSDTKTGHIADVRKMWNTVLRRTVITDLTPHDLRHHFASVMSSSGSSQALIAAMLAHSSIASSHRYVHAFKDAKREASERTAATIMGGASDDNVVPLIKRGA